MATSSFRDLVLVCEALGLKRKDTKNGEIYKGYANSRYCRISIHAHAMGRNIATGTFARYVKDLGFESEEAFKRFLNSL